VEKRIYGIQGSSSIAEGKKREEKMAFDADPLLVSWMRKKRGEKRVSYAEWDLLLSHGWRGKKYGHDLDYLLRPEYPSPEVRNWRFFSSRYSKVGEERRGQLATYC